MKIDFEEKQRFTQWWLWILLIGIVLIPVYGIYKQIIMGQQLGNNPLPNYGLFLLLIFMLAIAGFFWKMQLTTKIDNEAIRMNFWPLAKKEIKWAEIDEAKVTNYGFVGGWGVRIGTDYGTVYNTSGKIGLAIRLKNGRKLCIGTQKEAELKEVIAEAGRQQKL